MLGAEVSTTSNARASKASAIIYHTFCVYITVQELTMGHDYHIVLAVIYI